MANIIRRDPLRAMRDLFNWDPFSEMTPYAAGEEAQTYLPKFEVKETQDGYLFKADLPGVKEEDVDISLTGNRLTIGGQRSLEACDENDRFYSCEIAYGNFNRSFTLPEGIDGDHMRAELKNGELRVTVPKKPEAQPRKISLKPGGGEKKAKA